MSNKLALNKKLQTLTEAARAGNPKAKAALGRVQSSLQNAVAAQITGALAPPPEPVPVAHDPEAVDEIIDIEGSPDEIDQADAIEGEGLAHAVKLKQQQRADRQAVAPYVDVVAPPSIDRGQLGNQQQIWPPGTPAQPINSPTGLPTLDQNGKPILQSPPGASGPVELCRWMGETAETRPVTVLLGIVEPIATIGGEFSTPLPRCYCHLQFGTTGYMQTMYVDYGSGLQLTLPASQVVVQATQAIPFAGTGEMPVQLSAMLSFFATQKQDRITLTVDVDSDSIFDNSKAVYIPSPPYAAVSGVTFDPSTQTPLFPIPPFARVLFFRGTTNTNGSGVTPQTTIQLLDAGQLQIDQFDVAGGASMVEPVPIMNEAVFVKIKSSTNLVRGALIFGLSF